MVFPSGKIVTFGTTSLYPCYTCILVFHLLEKRIQKAVADHVKVRYGSDAPVALEQPKQSDFGELALPIAFQLARQLKKAPKAIATELADELGSIEGVASLEVAGN